MTQQELEQLKTIMARPVRGGLSPEQYEGVKYSSLLKLKEKLK
jgi:hypothetical protein